jgi:hypothetical protein
VVLCCASARYCLAPAGHGLALTVPCAGRAEVVAAIARSTGHCLTISIHQPSHALGVCHCHHAWSPAGHSGDGVPHCLTLSPLANADEPRLVWLLHSNAVAPSLHVSSLVCTCSCCHHRSELLILTCSACSGALSTAASALDHRLPAVQLA